MKEVSTMENNHTAWVIMDAESSVISNEHENAQSVLDEMSDRGYTINEMRANGFTLNKLLIDAKGCWIECLDEIEIDYIDM